jgi:hypothetical protein
MPFNEKRRIIPDNGENDYHNSINTWIIYGVCHNYMPLSLLQVFH